MNPLKLGCVIADISNFSARLLVSYTFIPTDFTLFSEQFFVFIHS